MNPVMKPVMNYVLNSVMNHVMNYDMYPVKCQMEIMLVFIASIDHCDLVRFRIHYVCLIKAAWGCPCCGG